MQGRESLISIWWDWTLWGNWFTDWFKFPFQVSSFLHAFLSLHKNFSDSLAWLWKWSHKLFRLPSKVFFFSISLLHQKETERKEQNSIEKLQLFIWNPNMAQRFNTLTNITASRSCICLLFLCTDASAQINKPQYHGCWPCMSRMRLRCLWPRSKLQELHHSHADTPPSSDQQRWRSQP